MKLNKKHLFKTIILIPLFSSVIAVAGELTIGGSVPDTAIIGGTCDNKYIGTTSNGTLVVCQNGIWKSLGNELPVSSIYISTTTANPSTTLGYGTWVSFGEGKVLVGQDTGDSDFDSIGETGGSKTDSHQLTAAEMPTHNHGHTGFYGDGYPDGSADRTNAGSSRSYVRHTKIDNQGGNQAHIHDILQPYIVVKMWRRIE